MIGLLLLALASDPPFFRSIEAEASLEADGSITLIEKELIENEEWGYALSTFADD